MLSRRTVLGSLALSVTSSVVSGALSSPQSRSTNGQGLGALAAARGIVYGCAASTYMLRDINFVSALTREAKILVAEYEMKRAALEPQPGRYDFAASDALVRFANDHRMAFRGHTLLWHKAN